MTQPSAGLMPSLVDTSKGTDSTQLTFQVSLPALKCKWHTADDSAGPRCKCPRRS